VCPSALCDPFGAAFWTPGHHRTSAYSVENPLQNCTQLQNQVRFAPGWSFGEAQLNSKQLTRGNVFRFSCAFRLQVIENKHVSGGGGGSRTRVRNRCQPGEFMLCPIPFGFASGTQNGQDAQKTSPMISRKQHGLSCLRQPTV
jgi:hypothetical protein